MRTWCKGDEPVRVGSKVLCNYEGREDFEGKLEPVGVVVHHDGSASSHRPWIVLVKRISGVGWDHNYFVEGELKVLDNYDSAEGFLLAVEDIAPTKSIYLNILLAEVHDQFGKVHRELENE